MNECKFTAELFNALYNGGIMEKLVVSFFAFYAKIVRSIKLSKLLP